MMKRFAQLSRKIKEILDILSKQGNQPNEDDAMLTKKHLGPVACASCEKNLINIYGQAVDHYPWKKLPFRDPNERLARYGQGFSKILSNMRPVDNYGHHHSSVDDANVNYHGSHSTYPETVGNVSEQGFKTTTGFMPRQKEGRHSSIDKNDHEAKYGSAGKNRFGSNTGAHVHQQDSLGNPIYNGSAETLPHVRHGKNKNGR
jgi:hypothetical protein